MQKPLFLFLVLFLSLYFTRPIFADNLDQEIEKLSSQIAALEKAIAPLKKETQGLVAKIALAKKQVAQIEKTIVVLNQNLDFKSQQLDSQKQLFNARTVRLYKNSKLISPLQFFLASAQVNSSIRQYAWFQNILNHDQKLIFEYVSEINKLNTSKSELQSQKSKLLTLKNSLESRFGFLQTEITKAETYKQELSKKQQQLIAQKEAMFSTSVGDDSSLSGDPASRLDYNPGFSPAYAVFSFGAPHRKGMSQFGAYGRAKSGQNYQTILKAYYGDVRIETKAMPDSIKTTQGTLPFEGRYLLGIAEMPINWADSGGYEALKAQAIAARTYALNYLKWRLDNPNIDGTICVTEACQVYKSSRADNPGAWKKAVEETQGMVLVSNRTNNIFSTFYASTSGGATLSYSSQDHTTLQLWDTGCSAFSCWPQDSYEKKAGSPWYYKGWYKTRSGISAGRSHPWLTQEEFSDIVNANLYFAKTHDQSHLSQTQNCLGSCDSNAWSPQELTRQLNDKGGGVTTISSISVNYSTSGYTQTIHLSTNLGNLSFSGEDFKQIFSLRAPGALHIKSLLFNLEKK